MSPEQQLERSVLERKEREELHAIATAMGVKANTRTKKADLVDRILEATGVGTSNGQSASSKSEAATTGDGGQRDADSAGAAAPAAPRAAAPARADTGNGSSTGDSTEAPGGGGGSGEDADANASSNESHDASASAGTAPQQQQDRPRFGADPAGGGGSNPGAGNAGPGNDPNRRSRRRRGRDRDRPAGGGGPGGGGGGSERGERDLAGHGLEQQYQGDPIPVTGMLDLTDQGYGFLRVDGYRPSPKDVYVSISQVRRFGLRKGDSLEGASRPAAANEKYPALLRIDKVSGLTPDEARARPRFEDLTPLFPDSRLRLEVPGDSANMVARIVDLISPIGKGQRGLIVSPPKAGKTTVLKQIAHSIEANNPEVHLIVLLVDERPEEVTDMRRSVQGEVIASTFDRPSDEHTQLAELAIERAKRLVEVGRDVVIVLDGITRLARAYNLAAPATGRIMSGGVDSGALYPPKKFFGAARNVEEGGSLTILATALVETGSRMDEVIFEEFKGTGNMELRLDRKLAERRVYPAIDVNASSTRHEELLFDRTQLKLVWLLRRVLNGLAEDGSSARGLEMLVDRIKSTKSNDEFLAEVAKAPVPTA